MKLSQKISLTSLYFTGEREISMLASGLKLKAKNNVLSLVSDEGVIDDTISINDITKDKQSFVLNKIQFSS